VNTPATLSRPFDFRLGLGLPIALMALLLMFDPAPLDFALARLFYTPEGGFVGRYSFWLEDILHNGVKQAVILLAVAAVVCFLGSFFSDKLRSWRLNLAYLLVALVLSTGIVTPLKMLTAVHCPWSLTEFGGAEHFTALLESRAPSDNPGRCWPAGHAAAGFSLISLFFALRDRRPRAARIALAAALAAGMIFSVGRMMQGAHFLSHNIWTLLFDWLICLLCYRWILYRRAYPQEDGESGKAGRRLKSARPELVERWPREASEVRDPLP
jgi:membrane-associated PAP2 superfamily phosphatase